MGHVHTFDAVGVPLSVGDRVAVAHEELEFGTVLELETESAVVVETEATRAVFLTEGVVRVGSPSNNQESFRSVVEEATLGSALHVATMKQLALDEARGLLHRCMLGRATQAEIKQFLALTEPAPAVDHDEREAQ